MVPRSILKQIGKLRRREVVLRFAWGGARWLAIVGALLALACLIDWIVDRDQDTPWALRIGLLLIQIAVAMAAAGWFLVRPLLRSRLDDTHLALLVEDRHPQFEHRLISAVQLNQPGAFTEGMSPELIAQVTREAEKQASEVSFTSVADTRRLGWSALAAGPVALAGLAAVLLWPSLVLALLQRQLLLDRDVPRAVTLTGVTREVWPIGEKITLRFKVNGKDLDQYSGEVLVEPDGLPADRYPLEKEWASGSDEAFYVCEVYPGSADFSYRAWMGDGRTRRPLRVHLVARPVIEELAAWTLLPPFCDPAGKERYAQIQPRGDITGIPGSLGRVAVKVQKPVARAFVELLSFPDTTPVPKRKVDLALDETGHVGVGEFELRSDETAYRVQVIDEHGFVNVPPPQRLVRLVPEEPPQISLLPEILPPANRLFTKDVPDDFDIEGMPVLIGGSIPIAYTCTGPYGLGHARLLFRVLKKAASGNDEPAEERWLILPLAEVKGSKQTGPFNPLTGGFAKSGPRDQVPFHAVPALAPQQLGRIIGGGRFDFRSSGIPDGKGGTLTLKEGDQIEYCVEIFADRDPKSGRPSARSESRVKTVVSFLELARWIGDNVQEARRIRELNDRQAGVFEMKR
jgi:hypothetical protein